MGETKGLEILIRRKELVGVVKKIRSFLPKRAALPVLGYFLIEAKHNAVVLSATDLEKSVRVMLPRVGVKSPGAVLAEWRTFSDFVLKSKTENWVIKGTDNGYLSIDDGEGGVVGISGMDRAEFPVFPKPEDKLFPINLGKLSDMINSVSFSIDKGTPRNNLDCLNITLSKPGIARVVTSDGHRLSILDGKLDWPTLGTTDILLPRDSAKAIVTLFDGSKEGSIGVNKNHLFMRTSTIEFTSRLREGEFPDYKHVIPKGKFVTTVRVSSEEILTVLNKIKPFVPLGSGIHFSTSEGCVELSSPTEFSKNAFSIRAEVTGDRKLLTTVVSPFYLEDAVRFLEDRDIVFSFKNGNEELYPDPIRMLGAEKKDRLHLLMPMRG